MEELTDAKKSSDTVASTKCKEKSCRCGGGGRLCSEQRIPNDLVVEVLQRLPVKPLVQFKCVSKLWHSIISDPGFMKSHRSNSDGLLINFTDIDATSPPGQPVERFLRVFSDRTLHHQASVLLAEHNITQVINGLVCLYVNTDNLILLCNIFTHEILKLPSPQFDTRLAKYYFGYDPINDLYKLLKLHLKKRRSLYPILQGANGEVGDVYSCEVLTLGIDSSWRIIPSATLDLKTQSICINGVLYWGQNSHPKYTVTAFDLLEEKFWVKTIPNYMTEMNRWNRFNVMELGGKLTLVQVEACLFNDGKLILWELVENDDDGHIGELESWTKCVIKLPKELQKEGCCFPVGSLPTGELLLTDYRIRSPMTVYSYDRAKAKFEKILMANFPSSLAVVCREAPRLQITYHKVARLHQIIRDGNSVSSLVPFSDPFCMHVG